MKAFSASSNIPLDIVRVAKAMGCPGFEHNGKCYGDIIIPWITEHMDELEASNEDDIKHWKMRLVRAQALNEELKLEESKQNYISKKEVAQMIKNVAMSQKSILKARLTQELPQKLVGLDVPKITQLMDDLLVDVCKLMEKLKI